MTSTATPPPSSKSTTGGALPLLPPPPLPPEPSSSSTEPSKKKEAAAPQPVVVDCPPKVDALLHLLQHAQSKFDKSEKQNLKSQPVGNELQQIFLQCRPYRGKLLQVTKHIKEQQLERQKSGQCPTKEQQHDQTQLLKQHTQNYQNCLASAACPERYQTFRACWNRMPPQVVQEFEQHRMTHYLCDTERQAVERCVGTIVSRGVRAAVGTAEGDIEGSDHHHNIIGHNNL